MIVNNELTKEQKETLFRLHKNLPYYAQSCIKIRTKSKGVQPFIMNRVQHCLHFRANLQMKRIGKIRRIVVKARQQGCSEYICCRGFKNSTQTSGYVVYILSHEASSTQTLYDKVLRYYKYCPDYVKPGTTTSNRNELKFDIDSEYALGTAGSENTGRSKTVNFWHWSEVAHSPDADGIKAGVMQTVSDGDNSEMWWETTANGKNWFYQYCIDILAKIEIGETDWEIDFFPWNWTDEYSKPLPPGMKFERTEEEESLSERATTWDIAACRVIATRLSDEQLYWRRVKIGDIGERLFKQEYPFTFEEAFQFSGQPFHDTDLVDKAMKSTLTEESVSPVICGVDPARTRDRTVFTYRRGRVVRKQVVIDNKKNPKDAVEIAGMIKRDIDNGIIDKVVLDWAYGAAIGDILKDDGYGQYVAIVNFGGTPDDPKFADKRAEMAFEFDAALHDGMKLPLSPSLAADIASMPQHGTSRNGKIKFPSKEDIKADIKRSPDEYDSLLLTYAVKVRKNDSIRVQSAHETDVRINSAISTQRRRAQANEDGNDGSTFRNRGGVWG